MNGIQALWDQVYASSARLLPVHSRTTLLLAAAPVLEPLPAHGESLCHHKPGAARPAVSTAAALTGPMAPQCPLAIPVLLAQRRDSEPIATRKVGLPGWVTAIFISIAVLLGVGGWIRGFPAAPPAKAATRPSAAVPQPAPAASPSAVDPPYPFASFIEVTGLRVVVDLNHRSQVQYLVVNHSAISLTGLGLRVAVRSGLAAAGSEPLFTVSARVPSLGPHQSKEIRTDLDSQLRETAIPDWDNLKAEVQVSAQP